jgi:predicted GNAT family N-acyltransferase
MNIVVKTFAYNSPEYRYALSLRNKILRKPLGLGFTEAELKKDVNDIHFGLFSGEAILACLILTECDNHRMKMRQVAVDDKFQGQGLGKKLSLEAENYARLNGFKVMFCHARKTAAPFYSKLGYHITGGEFVEVNIPHYLMEKDLTPNL